MTPYYRCAIRRRLAESGCEGDACGVKDRATNPIMVYGCMCEYIVCLKHHQKAKQCDGHEHSRAFQDGENAP